MRQVARPTIVWPTLATMSGLGTVVASWKLRRWSRRPAPAAPPHAGPVPPPEQVIAQTRTVAGGAPRNIKHVGGLVWPMPAWLEADAKDPLRAIYHDQEQLLSHGRIVWGCIVQANQLLFSKGSDDSPAAIIYSTDPYFDAHPEDLVEIADELFMVRGRRPTRT